MSSVSLRVVVSRSARVVTSPVAAHAVLADFHRCVLTVLILTALPIGRKPGEISPLVPSCELLTHWLRANRVTEGKRSMTGLGALAVGAAPLAGGLLLGGMAGKGSSSIPDLRAVITSELELLQQLPETEVTRRAALKQMIEEHVDDLLVSQEKSREFQRKTRYFTEEGHWRDIVLLVTILLFAVIAWHADHHRPVWLPLFIATLVVAVITVIALVHGFLTSIRADDGDHDQRDGDNDP